MIRLLLVLVMLSFVACRSPQPIKPRYEAVTPYVQNEATAFASCDAYMRVVVPVGWCVEIRGTVAYVGHGEVAECSEPREFTCEMYAAPRVVGQVDLYVLPGARVAYAPLSEGCKCDD